MRRSTQGFLWICVFLACGFVFLLLPNGHLPFFIWIVAFGIGGTLLVKNIEDEEDKIKA